MVVRDCGYTLSWEPNVIIVNKEPSDLPDFYDPESKRAIYFVEDIEEE